LIDVKYITLGGLLIVIAVLFQLTPVFLTELFVPITMLSALPIYLITRLNPKYGAVALIATALVTSLVSVHEGMFFLFTNGPVGFSLGICSHYIKNLTAITLIASIILTISLSAMTFIIGIPVFGARISSSFVFELAIIFTFSNVYSFLYLKLSNYMFRYLIRLLKNK
jgi:hypothetical protein